MWSGCKSVVVVFTSTEVTQYEIWIRLCRSYWHVICIRLCRSYWHVICIKHFKIITSVRIVSCKTKVKWSFLRTVYNTWTSQPHWSPYRCCDKRKCTYLSWAKAFVTHINNYHTTDCCTLMDRMVPWHGNINVVGLLENKLRPISTIMNLRLRVSWIKK